MAKTKSFSTSVTVGATAILGLNDVNFSGADVTTHDLTTHDSAAKEYVPGLVDYGTFELNGKFDDEDTGQNFLRDNVGVTAAFVATYPNGASVSFSAIIGAMNETSPTEGTVDFSVSCKITGVKTYASAP